MPDDFRLIDAYWRAANYLSVGQIYLLDNPLLREPLRAGARQAAAARPLGHDARSELHLRAPEPRDPRARPERDLRHRPGPRRSGARRQHLPRGHLQRGLPAHRPRRGGAAAAVPAVLLPRRDPQPRRARDAGLDPRGRRARLLAACTPTAPRSTTRTCSSSASSATARPRPGRWRRAGTRTSSSTRRATARCCRSCTSTATRSPTRRCSRGSPATSCERCSRATATRRASSRAPSPTAMHELMAATLDEVLDEIARDPAGARGPTASAERPRWPMIVLRTPKGWTGPEEVDGLPVEGTFRAHQVPLADVRDEPRAPRAARGVDALLPARGAVRRGRRAASRARRSWRRRASGGWAPTRTPTAALLLRELELPDFRDYARRGARRRRTTTSEATRVLGDVPARRDAREPRPLPDHRARRDGVQPARGGVRGDRPGVGGASAWTATTTSRPTAG